MTESSKPDESDSTESPFDQPDIMTGYPLTRTEQERVDRLVEESIKEEEKSD